jgi:chromosome partitioning protein
MPIILMVNLKGGVAKTTNAVAIAECLANSGLRTLLIDADHQCMSGELLLGEARLTKCDRTRTTLHDLLAAMLDDDFRPEQFEHFIIPGVSNIGEGLRSLSLLPCSVRIDDFQTNMAKAKRGYQSNDEFLKTWGRRRAQMTKWLSSRFDYVLVDCPPSLAIQVKFLLPVADGFIVPSVPDTLSVRGSLYLLDRLQKLGYSRLRPIGTLWSLYREQNRVHREVVEKTAAAIAPFDTLPRPFETIIPNMAAIADANEGEKSSKTFKHKYGKAASLFESLSEEIIARTQWDETKTNSKAAKVLTR